MLIAALIAMLAIYIDCYQAVKKQSWHVPRHFFLSVKVFSLALACGVIAATAYWYTDPKGTDAVSTILTFKIENPYGRAFYVGVAILVLIRSKLFQFQGANFGGDYFYSEARTHVLATVMLNWANWRTAFIDRNMNRTFLVNDYAPIMIEKIRDVTAVADPDFQLKNTPQIEKLEGSAPAQPMNAATPAWKSYHKAITSLALSTCGRNAFRELQPAFDLK